MRRIKQIMVIGVLILSSTGCANQDAAHLGSFIGRTLGKPIGTVATAIDETFQTTGDIIKENPRYRQRQSEQKAVPATSQGGDNDLYYRTDALVTNRGPALIESSRLQETEDVSSFWR